MSSTGAPIRAAHDERRGRIGWAVVAVKIRSTRNRLAVTRRKSPVLTSLHFAVAVPGMVAFVSFLTVGFASALSETNDEQLATTMLGAMIALAVIGSFIGSSTAALQALYLADDIPFLLTLPIPLRVLFASKLVEAGVGTLPPAMLVVAATAGYGLVRAESWFYWPVALLVTVGCGLMATSVSVVVVSAVTRFIPPRRAKVFLLGISLIVIFLTVIAWRTLAPRPGVLGEVVDRDEYAPLWTALAWTPAGWGAEAMSAAGHGELPRALMLTSMILLAAAAAIGLSFEIFRNTFIRGLAQMRAVQTAVPSESLTSWLQRFSRFLPRTFGAVVLKEWLLLFRDLRRLSGAVWPVGMVLVYTVVLGRNGESSFGSHDFAFWSRNGSLALLPWGLSLGISVYSYGSEGRNVHLMRSLPLSPAGIFGSKVVASLLPVGVGSLGAAALSLWIRQAPLESSLQLMALIAWMVAGYVVIDTAASAIVPNFETDHVQKTIGLMGRLISFAAGGMFGLATFLGTARLVMFVTREPESFSDILRMSIGGVEIFGWPLIALAFGSAALIVLLSATAAIRATERLVAEGA